MSEFKKDQVLVASHLICKEEWEDERRRCIRVAVANRQLRQMPRQGYKQTDGDLAVKVASWRKEVDLVVRMPPWDFWVENRVGFRTAVQTGDRFVVELVDGPKVLGLYIPVKGVPTRGVSLAGDLGCWEVLGRLADKDAGADLALKSVPEAV